MSINGQDAVYLNVLRVPGGNTIDIVDQVKDKIATLKNLPPGVHVEPIFDQSTFVQGRPYHGLETRRSCEALVLVAVVILRLPPLGSARGTLVVSVAIPLSFAITLIVLYACGETLNAFTLGGLTLAMGRLVDDAVVVLESIHRCRKRGMDAREAALQGTRAVVLPVLASTLTTMAVLLPVLLFAGLAQKLFVPLALTVAVAMAASYFVRIGVDAGRVPLPARAMPLRALPDRSALRSAVIAGIAEGYAELAQARVLPTAGRSVAIACCDRARQRQRVGRDATAEPVLPADRRVDGAHLRAHRAGHVARGVEQADRRDGRDAPQGAAARARHAGVDERRLADERARGDDEPELGPAHGLHPARADGSATTRDAVAGREIADQIRHVLAAKYPGVEFLQWPGGLVASVFSNGYLAPIAVEIRSDNLDQLYAQMKAVAEVAREVPGIRDVYPTLQLEYPEVRVDTDREEAGMVGVTARDAAQTTLDSTMGNINLPSVWVDSVNGQSYYVVTGYDPTKLDAPATLATAPVKVGERSAAVTLGAYGNITRSTGPIAIERNQLARAAHVLMQVEGRDIGTAAADLEDRLAHDPRTSGFATHFVGQVELMRTTFSGLGLAVALAVMVVFMIMASQFKSLKMPFIMLFTIPCTLVGITIALMAGGQGFSVTALMGILMVVGIAVSNGILLVDHARVKLDEGMAPRDAILDAARTRFVPIAMTSLATVIGLVPTAFALDRGAAANQPLALAVVGGLTSSTILSLYLVPVIFLALTSSRRAAARPSS